MTSSADTGSARVLRGVLSPVVVIGAVADDAGIRANFIGIASQVEGPIPDLNVRSRMLR